MTTKDTLRDLDATIATALDRAGMLDTATIAGTTLTGYFVEEFAEEGESEDAVAGVLRTFDCRAEDLPTGIIPDDFVTVAGYGSFRYLRAEHRGNGRALVILGTLL